MEPDGYDYAQWVAQDPAPLADFLMPSLPPEPAEGGAWAGDGGDGGDGYSGEGGSDSPGVRYYEEESYPGGGAGGADIQPMPAGRAPDVPRVEVLPDGSFVYRGEDSPGVRPMRPPSEDQFTRNLDKLVEVGIAALRLNQAYRQTGAPSVRLSGSAGAYATVARRDGYLYSSGPAGQSKRKPDKGVPYLTDDGAMIVNNGDGTFDLADGGPSPKRMRYPDAATGLPSLSLGSGFDLRAIPPAVWALGAVAALALLRR